jgi:hypothetical protein
MWMFSRFHAAKCSENRLQTRALKRRGRVRPRIGCDAATTSPRYCSIAEQRLQEFPRFVPLAETASRCAAGMVQTPTRRVSEGIGNAASLTHRASYAHRADFWPMTAPRAVLEFEAYPLVRDYGKHLEPSRLSRSLQRQCAEEFNPAIARSPGQRPTIRRKPK